MRDLTSQEDTIGIMDSSLYDEAVRGKSDAFKKHDSERLKRLVTPFDKNTILHIHITARCRFSSYPRSGFFRAKSEALLIDPSSSISFVKQILEICPDLLYQQNAKGETLLHIAARHGHEDIVKSLFDYEKKISLDQEAACLMLTRMVNKVKDAALHEAVRYGHLKVVEELIERDRDHSYEVNDAGESPLYLAAEKGFSEAVDKILKATTSPAYQGPGERTALHAAVLREDKEMTKTIIKEMGFLATKADEQGWLPLHYAAQLGFLPIVKILLDYDKSTAYIANEIDNRKTALHLAAMNGHDDIMDELISHCPGCWEQVDAKGRNVLHYAVEGDNEFAVYTILYNTSLSNLINEKDIEGNTPLHRHFTSHNYLEGFVSHPKVDRHAFNKRNINPLDVILSQNNLWDDDWKKSKKTLERMGAKSGQRIVNREESSEEESNEACQEADDYMMTVIKEAREPHLVVATLIATVSFAAALTLPGGYRSDGTDPLQGHAILTKELAFKAFVVSDAVALTLSSSAVFYHLFMACQTDKPKLVRLFKQAFRYTIYALVAMVVAFITGTYAVLSHCSGLAIATTTLCCYFLLRFWYDYFGVKLLEKLVLPVLRKCVRRIFMIFNKQSCKQV